MTFVLLLLVLFLQLLPLLFTQQPKSGKSQTVAVQVADEMSLLESGHATKLRAAPRNSELKIVSYNIRWRSGDDLKELIRLLREDVEIGSPSVVALQEVDRQKKRSGKTNTAKQLAEELGLYYAWAAPPSVKGVEEEETGVALLSPYPLFDVRRIVLPHEGPGHRRRVALGACVKLDNVDLRIYSA
ncbi:MAG TPA: endonuclease/exonuclease/phosphatase family protein, partial [Pyrinomonadaceae bacterium]